MSAKSASNKSAWKTALQETTALGEIAFLLAVIGIRVGTIMCGHQWAGTEIPQIARPQHPRL